VWEWSKEDVACYVCTKEALRYREPMRGHDTGCIDSSVCKTDDESITGCDQTMPLVQPLRLKSDDGQRNMKKGVVDSQNTLTEFGYYYGMESHDDLARFVGHSTCAFVTDRGTPIHSVPALAQRHIAQLAELQNHQMCGVLPITGVFWKNTTALLSNWQTNWKEYWVALTPHAAEILAFYPLDEPAPAAIASGDYGKVVRAIHASVEALQRPFPIIAVVT
jgi:hypothetical protein